MVTSAAPETPMATATVFLRTSLFIFSSGETHVPAGVSAIRGALERIGDGGVTVRAEAWLDERGRTLEGPSRTLFVPMSKVDHLDIQEAE